MINGVKVNLVYHFYCKNIQDIQVGGGNIYNEINRRCLEHFHNVFDTAVFCVCVDDTGDSELIQGAIKWIWSCGFKDNVTIKVKPNSPYRDAQTFYDEVVSHLSEFDGMVFFGHNKGNTKTGWANEENNYMAGLKQWTIFSYFACLDKIEEKINQLCSSTVVYTYVPVKNEEQKEHSIYSWLSPGSIFLMSPKQLLNALNVLGRKLPVFSNVFFTESFFSNIFDIENDNCDRFAVAFDSFRNAYFVGIANYYTCNHLDLISYFLSQERVDEYREFYEKIMNGL